MGDSNFRPQAGAHCLVDLRFRSKQYMAGEAFPIRDVSDDKLRQMHSAKRIAFGPPSEKLLQRARKRLQALEMAPAMTEQEVKAELDVAPAPGPSRDVQDKLRAKGAEIRAAAADKRDSRVSSSPAAKRKKRRKGPVQNDVRATRAAAGVVPDDGADLGDDPSAPPPVIDEDDGADGAGSREADAAADPR